MTPKELLRSRLRQVSNRLHRRTIAMGALLGLSLTAACSSVLLFAAFLTPVPHAVTISAAFLAFGAIVGALLAPKPPLRDTAILADRIAGTEEVLSTALETDPADPFGAATLARAIEIVQQRPARTFVSAARGRPPWLLFVPMAVFGILLVLPGLPAPPGARQTAQLSPERLRRLEKDSREIKRLSVEIENKELANLSQEMNRLLADVKQGKLDKKEALAQLAKLAEKAEGIRKDLEAQEKSLAELGKNPDTKAMADAIARGDLDAAKKQAGDLARQLESGAMSAESKGALKDALSKMGADAKGAASDKTGDAARQASEAMQKGDSGAFGEQMSKLAESMKGARSGKGGAGKNGDKGPENEPGALDDATADLGDAKEDLTDGNDGGQTAKNNDHCESCGRRKDPGGN